ncbi:MAG: hypothetical protein ACE5FI_01430 [Anaerolineales bacterium]
MVQIPRRSRALLGASVVFAVVLLYWLSLEDTTLNGVIAVGIAAAVVVTGHVARRRWGGSTVAGRGLIRLGAGVGVLAGLLSAPLTVLLMLTKVGLHSHTYPDYSAQQMFGVLRVWPIWIAAGVLFGLALGAALFLLRGETGES